MRCPYDTYRCKFDLGEGLGICDGDEKQHEQEFYIHKYDGRCGAELKPPNQYREVFCVEGHFFMKQEKAEK